MPFASNPFSLAKPLAENGTDGITLDQEPHDGYFIGLDRSGAVALTLTR
jgi:hypothetical protein